MENRIEQKFIIELMGWEFDTWCEIGTMFQEYRKKAGIKQDFRIPKKYNDFLSALFAVFDNEDVKGEPIIKNLDK